MSKYGMYQYFMKNFEKNLVKFWEQFGEILRIISFGETLEEDKILKIIRRNVENTLLKSWEKFWEKFWEKIDEIL